MTNILNAIGINTIELVRTFKDYLPRMRAGCSYSTKGPQQRNKGVKV